MTSEELASEALDKEKITRCWDAKHILKSAIHTILSVLAKTIGQRTAMLVEESLKLTTSHSPSCCCMWLCSFGHLNQHHWRCGIQSVWTTKRKMQHNKSWLQMAHLLLWHEENTIFDYVDVWLKETWNHKQSRLTTLTDLSCTVDLLISLGFGSIGTQFHCLLLACAPSNTDSQLQISFKRTSFLSWLSG